MKTASSITSVRAITDSSMEKIKHCCSDFCSTHVILFCTLRPRRDDRLQTSCSELHKVPCQVRVHGAAGIPAAFLYPVRGPHQRNRRRPQCRRDAGCPAGDFRPGYSPSRIDAQARAAGAGNSRPEDRRLHVSRRRSYPQRSSIGIEGTRRCIKTYIYFDNFPSVVKGCGVQHATKMSFRNQLAV